MKKANEDIRTVLKESGVKQWELAEKYGKSETGFCAMLRHELSGEEKARLFMLIQEIVDERNENKKKRQERLQNMSKEELVEMIMQR